MLLAFCCVIRPKTDGIITVNILGGEVGCNRILRIKKVIIKSYLLDLIKVIWVV